MRLPIVKGPVIRGTITRRLLVSFRVDTDAVVSMLPSGSSPRLKDGRAIAGICLTRLEELRTRFVPIPCGSMTESALHLIAVEPNARPTEAGGSADKEPADKVFVARRDVSSLVGHLAGGHRTPDAERSLSTFEVDEEQGCIDVAVRAPDGRMTLRIAGHVAETLPEGSVFDSVADAVQFLDGTHAAPGTDTNWVAHPMDVSRVESSFFDDSAHFPDGQVELDHAVLLHNVGSDWHPAPDLHGGRLVC